MISYRELFLCGSSPARLRRELFLKRIFNFPLKRAKRERVWEKEFLPALAFRFRFFPASPAGGRRHRIFYPVVKCAAFVLWGMPTLLARRSVKVSFFI